MMTDERDPLLQSLFVDAQRELSPEAFTAEVMARTRFVRYRIFLPLAGAGLVLALCAWYLAIPLELAQLVAQVLTATLIDLGDTWLAWLLSPVNNIAGLTVLLVKAIRVARKKIFGVSYAF